MWKLFHYNEYRYCYPNDTMSDVYDGEVWKYFEMLMAEGEKFIGLRFCSDGFDMFTYSGKSACPNIIQILNLPPPLRKTQQNFINRTTKNSGREACARDRIHRHIWVEGYDVKPNWVLSRKQCAAVDAKLKAIVCCPSERIPYDIMKKKGGVKAHDTHLFGAIFSSWALFRHLDIPAVVKHIKMWLQLGLMRSYIWVCNSSIMQE